MKKFMMALVCLMTMVMCFTSCGSKDYKDSESYEEAKAKAEALRDSIIESNLPIKSWDVSSEIDEMSNTKRHLAQLMSNNTIEQDFPYGKTKALIGIRCTKKYGNDALIKITSGQIHGSDYYDTNYVEVKFDDKPSKKYYYSEEASGASDVIFIKKKKEFIENCKKAKDIKIKIQLFQEGWKLFTFHVDDALNWKH